MERNDAYLRDFLPYALAALLIGLVGGFSTVLGPAFVQDLGIGYENTTWTTLAQAMSTAAFSPILGKAGDILGRRRGLLLGMVLFTLGNLFSALAQSLFVMILARFFVGLGTAAMAPGILAYIVTEFPPTQIARGFSQYMLISSGSVVLGPVLGGHLVATSGWRAMVWVCVGISAVILLICLLLPGRDRHSPGNAAGIADIPGCLLVPLFFSLMLCIPAFGQNFGWTSPVLTVAVLAAVAALVALIFAERRAKQPVLPGQLLKRPAFVSSILILFLTQGMMQANMTGSIIFVNYTRPESTLISGYGIAVMYLGMSIGAVVLGPLADRYSGKGVLLTALMLTGVGCGSMLLFSRTVSPLLLMLSLGILGVGLGGNGTILMKFALSGMREQDAGAGTGCYGLFRDLAAPFGVAVLVPLFTNTISALEHSGVPASDSAVSAIHRLAKWELLSVAAAICIALLLPNSGKKENPHETER